MGQSYQEPPPTLKCGHTLVVHFSSANILTTYYASLATAQQPEVRLPQSLPLESGVTVNCRGMGKAGLVSARTQVLLPGTQKVFLSLLLLILLFFFSYKPYKNQPAFLLSTLSSFFLYLFNRYLFNTYCVPAAVCTRCWCYKAEKRHLEAAIILLVQVRKRKFRV